MSVRRAVLSDPRSPEAVRNFARERLRMSGVNQFVVDAVIDVLLEDDWTALSRPDDELLAHFRSRTRDRHRAHRPVLESRLSARRIVSLSMEAGATGTLADLVRGPSDTEAEALAVGIWDDPRLGTLTAKLPAEGRAIVDIMARFPRTTWAEAAELAGQPPARGEQTRRRLRYLAHEMLRRQRLRPAR